MTKLQEQLFALQDKEYGKFQVKLIPGIEENTVIGVRIPLLRKLAKEFEKSSEYESFLTAVPHQYYDENMLHSILLSNVKSFEKEMELLELFLPYVDNWAVSDTIKPKVVTKHKEELLEYIKKWLDSDQIYTCRVGIEFLMMYFLNEDFKVEYLEWVAAVRSEEYYVNMMIAWYFATALAKQWEATIPFVEKGMLENWTHNKTIQKARESYRITEEQKEYLKSLKK